MRSAKTNRRSRAQRARRDAEAEMREPAPAYPPHGTVVGHIEYALHGQCVRAELRSTGRHARSYGVFIGGKCVGVMGSDATWRDHVRPAVRPMMSARAAGC